MGYRPYIRSMKAVLLFFLACLTQVAEAHGPAAQDLTALPLGDGKISQGPRQGWVWACRIDPQAGRAQVDGPWIDKARGTYDLTAKAIVPGNVRWPYRFDINLVDGRRIFSSNDLPSHPTGEFPIPSYSDAWRYDRNPNRIQAQNVVLDLPANPAMAPQPSCAPGAVGYLLSGAVLFNALDAPGRDAVAHETQDSCQGHPQRGGVYHYHSVSPCIDTRREANGHSTLVGYAIDGFGIYGHYGEDGKALTSADLDACHGHIHEIMWDGRKVKMYHYHATWDFPYTVGCLRGNYRMRDVMALSGGPGNGEEGPLGMRRQGGPQQWQPQSTSQPPQGRPDGFRDQRGPGPGAGPYSGDMGGRGGAQGHPDLNRAAATLGIDVERLRQALGPPPPDLQAAARRLGIDAGRLRAALDAAR